MLIPEMGHMSNSKVRLGRTKFNIRIRNALPIVQPVAMCTAACLPLISIPGVYDIELRIQDILLKGVKPAMEVVRNNVWVVSHKFLCYPRSRLWCTMLPL
jgi:hypothetical protein